MLNKNVCAKCRSDIWSKKTDTNFRIESHILKSIKTWVCPKDKMPVGKGQPPPNCDYKMEHAVSESVNIDKIGADDVRP